MGSSEIHELAVRMVPEGGREVRRELDNTAGQFEETADRSEEASQDLNRFSRKFTGALAVAGGILGGIAGKFLSMVPAVQDAFIGVSSVVDGLIMQFEQDFGPSIRDVGDRFFALAQDVREAESFMEALEIAATGTQDIVEDLRVSLLETAGAYTAELTVDVTQRVTTVLTDQETRDEFIQEQFAPEAIARRTADALPFSEVVGAGARFTTGAVREVGLEGAFRPPPNAQITRSIWRTAGLDEQVEQQEETNRILQDVLRETLGRDETIETTVAVDGNQLSPVRGGLTSGGN